MPADEKVEEKTIGPHDFVYVPSIEPHSISQSERYGERHLSLLIANVYEEDSL